MLIWGSPILNESMREKGVIFKLGLAKSPVLIWNAHQEVALILNDHHPLFPLPGLLRDGDALLLRRRGRHVRKVGMVSRRCGLVLSGLDLMPTQILIDPAALIFCSSLSEAASLKSFSPFYKFGFKVQSLALKSLQKLPPSKCTFKFP